MRRIAVDANVFVSFFIDRNTAQHAAARALIQSAEDGEIAAIVPQAVVFEVAYVVQSQYAVTGARLATVVKGVTSFPGTQVVDECRWKSVLEIWPDALTGLGDSDTVCDPGLTPPVPLRPPAFSPARANPTDRDTSLRRL